MQRINEKELNIYGERFASIDEMVRICNERQLNDVYSSDYSVFDTREVKDGKHYTHEESMKDLAYGTDMFNEEFAKISRETKLNLDRYLATKPIARNKRDFVGNSVSVGRVLAGQPNAFNRRVKTNQKVKTVNIYYSISCPWFYEAEERIKGGCTLMAITEALEKLGYQVAITLLPFFAFDDSSPTFLSEVALKDYKTRFNAKKIQFPLASKSVLFHLGCWWLHRSPEVTKNLGWCEGRAVDNDRSRLNDAKKYVKKHGGVFLSHVQMKDMGWDIGKAVDYVIEQVDVK